MFANSLSFYFYLSSLILVVCSSATMTSGCTNNRTCLFIAPMPPTNRWSSKTYIHIPFHLHIDDAEIVTAPIFSSNRPSTTLISGDVTWCRVVTFLNLCIIRCTTDSSRNRWMRIFTCLPVSELFMKYRWEKQPPLFDDLIITWTLQHRPTRWRPNDKVLIVTNFQAPDGWLGRGDGGSGYTIYSSSHVSTILTKRRQSVLRSWWNLRGGIWKAKASREGELAGAPRHRGPNISGVTGVIVRNSATPCHGKAKQSHSPTSRGSRRRRESLAPFRWRLPNWLCWLRSD